MISEQAIWTTIPAGFDEQGRLRLSIHVAPRLTTDDGDESERTLADYGSFSSWPDRLRGIVLPVQIWDGEPGGSVEVFQAELLSEPDADLWGRVFPPDTLLRPHAFRDHAKRNVHTFPVRDVLWVIEHTYGALSAAGPGLPSVADPKGPLAIFGALDGLADGLNDSQTFWEELHRAAERAGGSQLEDGRVVESAFHDSGLPWDQQAAQQALSQVSRFYYRPGSRRPDFPDEYVEPPPERPRFDFHQIMSLLGDHPAILRRLGLVIDLAVALEHPVGAVPQTGLVRVLPEGDVPEDPPRAPWTHYELDDEWFGARPASVIRIERGLVNLTPEFWDLFQVDVDGAALQAVGFGGTLGALKDPSIQTQDTPTETGAPALRSAGLALSRQGRGNVLLDDLLDHRGKNQAIEGGHADHVRFFAEDLVRGHRADVWDEAAPSGARWHTLHARVTEHHVDGLDDPIVVEDEGFIKATSASSERQDNPTPSDDLYLHETVAAWEGWSLSAPRPGKRIVEPGEGDNGTSVASYDPGADQALPIRSSVGIATGTLPRLRLGHTYRLRLRTVDLAGNSRPFAEDDYPASHEHLASEAQMYLRFEPVPSPNVLRRHLDTEGESLEHLVIRSDLDTTTGDYATSEEVVAALAQAGAPHTYAEDSQRHLAAPKGSAQMAEQDSRLEAGFGGSPANAIAALRVALREGGTFLDPLIVDTSTGEETIAQSTISLHPPGATLPAERGAGLGGAQPEEMRGAYAFYADANVVLPYLPDPMALGVALVGFDHAGAEVFSHIVPFPGDWPDLEPFRVRLSEGPIGAAFSSGVLEVTLPQAEVVRAELSSVFPKKRLDHFAIWQWTPPADRTSELTDAALAGRHWMLTPFRRVTFTHAVQHPLVVPDMTKVLSGRSLGRTYADFRGPILNHAKSTGRLDVLAAWTEDVDLLTDDAPLMQATGNAVPHSSHAFGFDLGPEEDAAEVARPGIGRVPRHEFGDTKHRRITYHSVATTRFREFLPRPIADDPTRIQRIEEAETDGEPKPMLVHEIPSSARPAAPEVLYLLPTFRWERDDDAPVRRHVRRGKAVRVWMRRPWFSSGDGEQLGVVLRPGLRLPGIWGLPAGVLELDSNRYVRRGRPVVSPRPLRRRPAGPSMVQPAPASPLWRADSRPFDVMIEGDAVLKLPEAAAKAPSAEELDRMLSPYVTQWGADPVWASAPPLLPPTVAELPRHISYAAGLTLEELAPDARVVVAGHEVHYDTDRMLWYSDIEIDAGSSYFPFVRLALARYQPHSVPDAHLSRVVMTDFIQVAPDRTAEVAPTRGGLEVTVRGFSGRNAAPDPWPPFMAETVKPSTRPNTEMRVAVERRQPGIPGDLGWERIGAETTLTAHSSGFDVTWTGVVVRPAAEGADDRLVITEIETHRADGHHRGPIMAIAPRDAVRERIVYADVFDL